MWPVDGVYITLLFVESKEEEDCHYSLSSRSCCSPPRTASPLSTAPRCDVSTVPIAAIVFNIASFLYPSATENGTEGNRGEVQIIDGQQHLLHLSEDLTF